MVLHNATIRSIVARCISGILLGIPWESSQIKNESDKYQDLCTGRWFLREIKWLLKRGEKNSRRPNAHSGFRQSDARDYEFEDQLLYSEVDNPSPSYNDRVNVLFRLPFSIPKTTIYAEQPYKSPINRTKWRRVRYMIEVVLKSAALEFQLKSKDQLMGSVEAQYVEC
ncbi:hypothetical protein FPQ18DRAFT_302039 [Pyronema domesticum]|nr:hypothetical protein FPQ18DRAFT_302039 [Pyronema domesticum]